MNVEIKKIRALIKSGYTGPAWHGPALMETLSNIPLEVIGKRINGSHNILELVNHIAAWRVFTIKSVERDASFDVDDSMNFSQNDNPTEADWKAALENLEKTQTDLLAILKTQEDSILSEKVNNRDYTFYFLLTGIVNHDLYHAGQIQLLKKV